MRFALLGSGSEGNSLVVEVGETRIMMDCGFSLSETSARLNRHGLSPSDLAGIVVTHEHGDHIGGVARLARKFSIPVYMTHGTLRSQNQSFAELASVTEINSHQPFWINDIQVQPYPVPHDAVEPVQFIFSDGIKRLGVLTDVGCTTPHIETMLSGCDGLILEFNHDAILLENSDYPYSLRQRISGRFGHLNNQDAIALLARLDRSKLQLIVAAHLSHKNNHPTLVEAALASLADLAPTRTLLATQNDGTPWLEI